MATVDLNDHPFSPQSVAFESGASSSNERRWLGWIAQAERLIGHSLDGNDVNEAGCGYSIDYAYDDFCSGETSVQHVAKIKSRARYDGGAFVRA